MFQGAWERRRLSAGRGYVVGPRRRVIAQEIDLNLFFAFHAAAGSLVVSGNMVLW
jgi:hypothetical protein